MKQFIIPLLFLTLSTQATQAEITTDIPNQVIQNQQFTLGFTIFNELLPISNAVFTYGNPSSFQINEVETTQGTCTTNSTVQCNLGTVSTGISITLKVTPLEVSKISSVASIKGNTRDCSTCEIKPYLSSKTISLTIEKSEEPKEPDIVVGFKNPSYIAKEGETLDIETISNTNTPIELSYFVSSGSADTNDYELVLGTIIDSDTIRLKILKDNQEEGDETLTLELVASNPDVKLQPNSTKITIVNVDNAHILNAEQHIKDNHYMSLGTIGIETAKWQINSIKNHLSSLRLGKRELIDTNVSIDDKSLPKFDFNRKPKEFSFFADGYFGTSDISGNGFSLGFDYGRNGKFIGLALGGNNSEDDIAELNSMNITGFATYQEDSEYYLEFLIGYGQNDWSINDYDGIGEQQIFSIGTGYNIFLNQFIFTPHLSLQNINIDNDGFNDNTLDIKKQKAVSTIFEVGVRTQLTINFNSFNLVPWINANYYLDNSYQELSGNYLNFDEKFDFRDESKETNISFEGGLITQFDFGNINLSYKQDKLSNSLYLNIFFSF